MQSAPRFDVRPGAKGTSPEPAQAFGDALEAARPELLARARGLVAGRRGLDAEDLVQEALARALRFQERYDPARPLLPWLRQVLLRRFLDELRRQGAAPVQPAVGRPERDAAAPAEPRDPTPDAAELAARRDEAEALLARLGEPERTLLDRFHRGGASIGELAAETGLPPGTIKSHLHRARRRLARELRQAEES